MTQKPKLSERHPLGEFKGPATPGKGSLISRRHCGRCGGHVGHPLGPGWRVGCDAEGEQIHVCPTCAKPDDPDVNGRLS